MKESKGPNVSNPLPITGEVPEGRRGSANEEYIAKHREEDVRALALKKVPDGVDATWCLQQIEGWQLARKKLPQWAATNGLWYPPRISMEQCSSEVTALYKRSVVERILPADQRKEMTDLTGGFGIDFSYLSQAFMHAKYVERQTHLCEIARHNFSNLPYVTVSNCSSEEYLNSTSQVALLYLDPARRDDVGRKVVALEDCSPNVVDLQEELRRHARYVLIKLSPMLDITQALRQLQCISEVHVVSVQGECKEVLLLIDRTWENEKDVEEQLPTYYCVDIRNDRTYTFSTKAGTSAVSDCSIVSAADICGNGTHATILFEPNASILKAGVQNALCKQFGISKLHPISNLFVGQHPIADFPGRQFEIEEVGDFSKQGIKKVLQGIKKANLTIRNFPSTVAELRKKLKLKEGGDVYLFATTLADDRHALIKTKKVP